MAAVGQVRSGPEPELPRDVRVPTLTRVGGLVVTALPSRVNPR